jgi:hypothetical protein
MQNRSLRILVAALALFLLVAGSALANRGGTPNEHASPEATAHQPGADEPGGDADQPEGDEAPDATPSKQLLDKVVDRLADAGIQTDADAVAALAADFGVGGAVRVLMWADATGKDPADIGAMFMAGDGWGEIAHQLNDADDTLDLSPGIGSVMSGGHGQGHAAGPAHENANRPE